MSSRCFLESIRRRSTEGTKVKPQWLTQGKHFAYAPQPNWGFNADANIGHAFGIFMAYVGALLPSASGAG